MCCTHPIINDIVFDWGALLKKELSNITSVFLELPKTHPVRNTLGAYKTRFEEYMDEFLTLWTWKKWHLISILVPWLAEAESSAIHCQLLGFERWDRGWGLFHPISIYIPIKDVHMFQHILWAIIHGGYVDIFLMHSAHAGEKLPPCEGPSQGHSDWAEEAKRFVNLGTTHGFALFGFWCHLAPRGKCLRTLLGNPGWYIYLYLVNI